MSSEPKKRTEKQSYAILERIREVWSESQVDDPTQVLVLTILASHSNADGICDPSVAGIAEKARISERQVTRILHSLHESGEIVITERRGRRNQYRFPTPDMDVTPDTTPDITPDTHVTRRTKNIRKEREETSPAELDDGSDSFVDKVNTYIHANDINPEAAQAWWKASNSGTTDSNGRRLKSWKKALNAYVANYKPLEADERNLEQMATDMEVDCGTDEYDELESFYTYMLFRNDGNVVWRTNGNPIVDKVALYTSWKDSDPLELEWMADA